MFKNLFKGSKSDKKPEKKANNHLHLKVTKVEKATADAIVIHFEQPATKVEYKSGQFLTLIREVNGESIRRAYSLCSSPFVDADLAVSVKRVEDGRMSNFLNEQLKAGEIIECLPPIGNFFVKPEPSRTRHIVLLGGGSGITPLISIAKTILSQEKSSTVSLIYGNRDDSTVIFKEELEQLKAQYADKFNLINVLSHPDGEYSGYKGFFTPELIKQILDTLPKFDDTDIQYFMCGPQPMMEMVRMGLDELEVSSDRIFKESFFNDPVTKDETVVEATHDSREVTVLYEGDEYKFTVEPDQTILEAALEADIELPYSCQSGLCTACRGKCKSGKVHLDEREGLSDSEIEAGYVLTCVGHPLSDDVFIEIG